MKPRSSSDDKAIFSMPLNNPPIGKLRPIRGSLGIHYEAYKQRLGEQALSKNDLVKKIWGINASPSEFANMNRADRGRFINAANAVRVASELGCRVEELAHIVAKADFDTLNAALRNFLKAWPLPLSEFSTGELVSIIGCHRSSVDQANASLILPRGNPILLTPMMTTASISDFKTAELIDQLAIVISRVGLVFADGDVKQAELHFEEYRKKLRDAGFHLISGKYVRRTLWIGGWNGQDQTWLQKVLVLKVSTQKVEENYTINRMDEPLNLSALEENDEVFFKELEDFLAWSGGKIFW